MTTTTPAIPDAETQAVTQEIAQRINGVYLINGHFVKMDTAITDGTITVDMTRRGFGDIDDCAIRVTLTLSAPESIPPAPVPDVIEPRSAALLEIWAPTRPDQPLDAA